MNTDLPSLPNPFETDPSDTKGRLLSAAARVFAERGYARATTRLIAAEAGLTEVTLFRHFGNKETLFSAVIEQFGGQPLAEHLEERLSGDYHQDLLFVGNLLMKVMLERIDSLRLMLCEATHFPEVRQAMVQNPRSLRQALARYFEEQIERGQIRGIHPEALAQAFMGMFLAYAISEGILHEKVQPEISTDELVACFVEIFLEGTLVEEKGMRNIE